MTALAFSPDAQTLASGAGVRIKLWNPASGGERLELPGFDEPPAQVNFRPDAPRLVTRTGLTLQEWDAETGAERRIQLDLIARGNALDQAGRRDQAVAVSAERFGGQRLLEAQLSRRIENRKADLGVGSDSANLGK